MRIVSQFFFFVAAAAATPAQYETYVAPATGHLCVRGLLNSVLSVQVRGAGGHLDRLPSLDLVTRVLHLVRPEEVAEAEVVPWGSAAYVTLAATFPWLRFGVKDDGTLRPTFVQTPVPVLNDADGGGHEGGAGVPLEFVGEPALVALDAMTTVSWRGDDVQISAASVQFLRHMLTDAPPAHSAWLMQPMLLRMTQPFGTVVPVPQGAETRSPQLVSYGGAGLFPAGELATQHIVHAGTVVGRCLLWGTVLYPVVAGEAPAHDEGLAYNALPMLPLVHATHALIYPPVFDAAARYVITPVGPVVEHSDAARAALLAGVAAFITHPFNHFFFVPVLAPNQTVAFRWRSYGPSAWGVIHAPELVDGIANDVAQQFTTGEFRDSALDAFIMLMDRSDTAEAAGSDTMVGSAFGHAVFYVERWIADAVVGGVTDASESVMAALEADDGAGLIDSSELVANADGTDSSVAHAHFRRSGAAAAARRDRAVAAKKRALANIDFEVFLLNTLGIATPRLLAQTRMRDATMSQARRFLLGWVLISSSGDLCCGPRALVMADLATASNPRENSLRWLMDRGIPHGWRDRGSGVWKAIVKGRRYVARQLARQHRHEDAADNDDDDDDVDDADADDSDDTESSSSGAGLENTGDSDTELDADVAVGGGVRHRNSLLLSGPMDAHDLAFAASYLARPIAVYNTAGEVTMRVAVPPRAPGASMVAASLGTRARRRKRVRGVTDAHPSEISILCDGTHYYALVSRVALKLMADRLGAQLTDSADAASAESPARRWLERFVTTVAELVAQNNLRAIATHQAANTFVLACIYRMLERSGMTPEEFFELEESEIDERLAADEEMNAYAANHAMHDAQLRALIDVVVREDMRDATVWRTRIFPLMTATAGRRGMPPRSEMRALVDEASEYLAPEHALAETFRRMELYATRVFMNKYPERTLVGFRGTPLVDGAVAQIDAGDWTRQLMRADDWTLQEPYGDEIVPSPCAPPAYGAGRRNPKLTPQAVILWPALDAELLACMRADADEVECFTGAAFDNDFDVLEHNSHFLDFEASINRSVGAANQTLSAPAVLAFADDPLTRARAFRPYALGVAFVFRHTKTTTAAAPALVAPGTSIVYAVFWGLNCAVRYVRFVRTYGLYSRDVWGHNASGFDSPMLLHEVISDVGEAENWHIARILSAGRSIISCTLRDMVLPGSGDTPPPPLKLDHRQRVLVVRCSLRAHFPGSLEELCTTMAKGRSPLRYTKLVNEPWTHDDISLANFETYRTRILPYLRGDVLGYAQALVRLFREEDQMFAVSLRRVATVPAAAKLIFAAQYYGQTEATLWPSHMPPLAHLLSEVAMRGGFSACLQPGPHRNVGIIDMCGMYPSIHVPRFPGDVLHRLPVGSIVYAGAGEGDWAAWGSIWDMREPPVPPKPPVPATDICGVNQHLLSAGLGGLVYLELRSCVTPENDHEVPLLSQVIDGALQNPRFTDWWRTAITTYELAAVLRAPLGARQYEFRGPAVWLLWRLGTPLRDFNNAMDTLKQAATAGPTANAARRTLAKLMGVAGGFGSLSLQCKGREQWVITAPHGWRVFFSMGALIDFREVPGGCICRVRADIAARIVVRAVGAIITACGRITVIGAINRTEGFFRAKLAAARAAAGDPPGPHIPITIASDTDSCFAYTRHPEYDHYGISLCHLDYPETFGFMYAHECDGNGVCVAPFESRLGFWTFELAETLMKRGLRPADAPDVTGGRRVCGNAWANVAFDEMVVLGSKQYMAYGLYRDAKTGELQLVTKGAAKGISKRTLGTDVARRAMFEQFGKMWIFDIGALRSEAPPETYEAHVRELLDAIPGAQARPADVAALVTALRCPEGRAAVESGRTFSVSGFSIGAAAGSMLDRAHFLEVMHTVLTRRIRPTYARKGVLTRSGWIAPFELSKPVVADAPDVVQTE